MSTVRTNSEADIWLRTLLPEAERVVAPHDAEAILKLRLSPKDLARADELGRKANAGTLTADEENELGHYLTVGRSIELMKAKVKLALREAERRSIELMKAKAKAKAKLAPHEAGTRE